MNITELARRLRISPQVLLEILPSMGYDIGKRAVKVDPRIAQRIMRDWKKKIAELERKQEQLKKVEEREQRVQQQSAPIALPSLITVREFAEKLSMPVAKVMKELMSQGVLATVNELIDFETASIIAQDLGFSTIESAKGASTVETELEQTKTLAAEGDAAEDASTPIRPPVVVVMGHIDHGKTKLLDAIRKTQVAESEHGGITQHIGAYQVEANSRKITFIDTPGHEAFMGMRARGARIADIAILVVAADDGVKPQTLEAIQIIKGAELPMVVAINKVDKPEANVDKTKSELSEHNVLGEEWGGKVPFVNVSAKEGRGIKELLEMILLVADLQEKKLRTLVGGAARGVVIESRVDKQEGVVSTILVQKGTLHCNDPLVIGGMLYGKVKLMRDERGGIIREAVPSTPARVLGFKVAPSVGDIVVVSGEAEAVKRSAAGADRSKELLDSFSRVRHAEGIKREHMVSVIVRADVLGSLEAILSEIQKIEHPEVGIDVIHRGLGSITDADVVRAVDTGAQLIGFNVNALPTAANLAHEKGVKLSTYRVIYGLLEDLRKDLEEKLSPEIRKVPLGKATVVKVFNRSGRFITVGARVLEGRLTANDPVDLLRGETRMGRVNIVELRSGREAIQEVGSGQECGVRINTREEVKEGDALVPYQEERITRTLGDQK